MTIFRRRLTALTFFGILALAAAAAVFGLDSFVTSRQREFLAFLTGATAIHGGDDLLKLEGRLVYTSGKPAPSRPLVDPDLGLRFSTVSLSRDTEIYQWIQTGSKHPRYRTKWVDAPVNSRRFKRPRGHENRGDVEFSSYEDHSETITVDGIAVDPAFVASVEKQMVPVTEAMHAQLPDDVRDRYVLDDGRLVEHAALDAEKSDPSRVGTNRISYRAAFPENGVVFGFMHGGRVVSREVEPHGRVGQFIPGAHDLNSMVSRIKDANSGGHAVRLVSMIAMILLAMGLIVRDISTATVIVKPVKFGR